MYSPLSLISPLYAWGNAKGSGIPPSVDTVKNLGWSLQFVALVVVGSALFLGLAYESMVAELSLLGLGILLFLLGKRLQSGD